MQADFSPQEIVQMALNIEEKGVNFYNEAAEMTLEKASKQLFLELACEEERHKDVIREMAQGLSVSTEQYEDEEAFGYINWLIEGKVFSEGGPETDVTTQELLRHAIEREKASLLFYYGMMDVCGESAQKVLRELVDEEKRHVVKLTKRLGEL